MVAGAARAARAEWRSRLEATMGIDKRGIDKRAGVERDQQKFVGKFACNEEIVAFVSWVGPGVLGIGERLRREIGRGGRPRVGDG